MPLVRGGPAPTQAHAISSLLNLAQCPDTVKAVAAVQDVTSACVGVIEQFFADADADGSGELDFDEFTVMTRKTEPSASTDPGSWK